MLKTSEAHVYTMTGKLEVILTCGSIETPRLLLLSGIGDPTELEKAGISPIVDLPDVGKNFRPLFTQPYVTSEGSQLDQYIQMRHSGPRHQRNRSRVIQASWSCHCRAKQAGYGSLTTPLYSVPSQTIPRDPGVLILRRYSLTVK
jgi:choline dehydrogenase-like flavoprotein